MKTPKFRSPNLYKKNIKQLHMIWDKFKTTRSLNNKMSQDETVFLSVLEREQLIDILFKRLENK